LTAAAGDLALAVVGDRPPSAARCWPLVAGRRLIFSPSQPGQDGPAPMNVMISLRDGLLRGTSGRSSDAR